MDAPHLSHLLDEAAARHPGGMAVEDEAGRSRDLWRARPHGRPARDEARALGRRARGSRGAVPAQVDRGRRGDPRDLEGGRGVCAGRPDGAGDPGAGILADAGVKAVIVADPLAGPLRDAWPAPGPLPRLIVVGEGTAGSARRTPPGTKSSPTTPRRPCRRTARPATSPTSSTPPARPAGPRAWRSRTPTPSPSSTGAATTSVPATATASPRMRRFTSICPSSTLYASVRHASPLVLIGEALAKDPRGSRRSSPSGGSTSGTRRRRSSG